jgi:hypothetical protein
LVFGDQSQLVFAISGLGVLFAFVVEPGGGLEVFTA